ncbi:hypothetical protein RC62_1406 [Flavobacterium aquidurense]|uniref:Uncharacterized protein n=1 Tax=Flavobacterium aquidurense TaxID=362413 RepID=A0A0Q0W037_9FLAO|nr:hypothetical protein RC62_1406 [Flavobacterium aquidurense]
MACENIWTENNIAIMNIPLFIFILFYGFVFVLFFGINVLSFDQREKSH